MTSRASEKASDKGGGEVAQSCHAKEPCQECKYICSTNEYICSTNFIILDYHTILERHLRGAASTAVSIKADVLRRSSFVSRARGIKL